MVWNIAVPRVRDLARLGDVDALVRLLNVPATPVDDNSRESVPIPEQAVAAVALGRLRAESAIPELAKQLDPNVPVAIRVCASNALREIGGSDAVDALRTALGDERYGIKLRAIAAVADHPRAGDVPKLVELVAGDRAWRVRCEAAEALGKHHDDAAIAVLRTAAERDRFLVALSATYALRLLGTPAGDQELRDLTKSAPTLIRRLHAGRHAHLAKKARRRTPG